MNILNHPKPKPKSSQAAPGPDVEAEIIVRMDAGISSNVVAESLKIPPRDVRRVYERETIRRAAKEEGALEEAPLSASAQEKLDAHKRKLDKEFDWTVRQKVITEVDEARASLKKAWKDNLGKLEDAWKRRGKVFTKAEFAKLLRVVHPDTGTNASVEELNAAFRLLNDRKIKLLDEEAFPTVAPRAAMHRTIEEMAEARARVKVENRERALKAAASRKAKQQEARS